MSLTVLYVDTVQEKSMMIVTHTSGLTTLTASKLNITFSERNRNRKASRDFSTGLSLRGGGQGFPPATKNVAPVYFHQKRAEK